MVIYIKKTGSKGIRYMRRNDTGLRPFVPADRVPPSVMRLFEETQASEMPFDEMPERPRCIFCEGPGTRKRLFSLEMLDMCEDHYYSKTLGAVAAQYKVIKEKRERDGILTPKSKAGKQKKQSQFRQGQDGRRDPGTEGSSGQGQGSEVE